METSTIAAQLAAYCREGKFEEAQKELYSDDAVSIEPEASPDFEKETKGRAALEEKMRKFNSMVETTHYIEISAPVIAAGSFAFSLRMDLTMKGKGKMDMNEICVYKVKDGKIISEEFFM